MVIFPQVTVQSMVETTKVSFSGVYSFPREVIAFFPRQLPGTCRFCSHSIPQQS